MPRKVQFQSPKILFLIPTLTIGGAERACINLASYLDSKGYSVSIQIASRKAVFYNPSDNIPVIYSPFMRFTRLSFLLIYFYRIYWFLKPDKKPDIIISFLWLTNYFASILSKKTGIPAILSVRSNPKWSSCSKMLFKKCKESFRYAAKTVVLADGASDFMRENFSLKQSQICVIHNPVSTPTSDASENRRPIQSSYLLAVGRLAKVKGYPRMLKIFASIHKVFPQEKLVICGSGPQKNEIESIIQKENLEDSVLLAGACKNIADYYYYADAMLFTSHFEGQPNVILEAQSCGCPVIAFDCDYGPSYLIQNGKTGFVIPDGDEAGMLNAVINYLKHLEMKSEFQKNMPEHLKQFAPDKIYKTWIHLIEEITDK